MKRSNLFSQQTTVSGESALIGVVVCCWLVFSTQIVFGQAVPGCRLPSLHPDQPPTVAPINPRPAIEGTFPAGEANQQVEKPDVLVRKISEIRSQLGGGVAATLQDLFPDGTDLGISQQELQHEFERELKKLESSQPFVRPAEHRGVPSAAGAVDLNPSLAARLAATLPTAATIGLPSQRRQPNLANPGGDVAPPLRSPRPLPSTVHLRSAARNLELAAAQLEEAGYFQQADQIRKTAGDFWLQARNSQASGRQPTSPTVK